MSGTMKDQRSELPRCKECMPHTVCEADDYPLTLTSNVALALFRKRTDALQSKLELLQQLRGLGDYLRLRPDTLRPHMFSIAVGHKTVAAGT